MKHLTIVFSALPSLFLKIFNENKKKRKKNYKYFWDFIKDFYFK